MVRMAATGNPAATAALARIIALEVRLLLGAGLLHRRIRHRRTAVTRIRIRRAVLPSSSRAATGRAAHGGQPRTACPHIIHHPLYMKNGLIKEIRPFRSSQMLAPRLHAEGRSAAAGAFHVRIFELEACALE